MQVDYRTRSVDKPGSPHYKLYFTHGDLLISPFHDIPLHLEENVFNMVVEIPRGETAKMEISKSDPLNPIKQDIKKGKLRHVNWAYPFNYGAFPQTWENPGLVDQHCGTKGDNDPVDVCDISGIQHHSGAVVQVKVLGCYAMIDEGETDWKVIAIDVNDPHANQLNDIGDVERVMPGKLAEVFAFLKYYKTPTGVPPNNFGFNGDVKDKAFTLQIIHEMNEQWRKLLNREIESKIIQTFSTIVESPSLIPGSEAEIHIVNAFISYVRGT